MMTLVLLAVSAVCGLCMAAAEEQPSEAVWWWDPEPETQDHTTESTAIYTATRYRRQSDGTAGRQFSVQQCHAGCARGCQCSCNGCGYYPCGCCRIGQQAHPCPTCIEACNIQGRCQTCYQVRHSPRSLCHEHMLLSLEPIPRGIMMLPRVYVHSNCIRTWHSCKPWFFFQMICIADTMFTVW